jgi:hypothetical protein
MESSSQKAKINGIIVDGQAHIQPGANNWIGIFIVSLPLFVKIQNSQESVIDYEGPFNCGEECVHGNGKGKIIYSCSVDSKDEMKINIQGLEKPNLEREVKQIRFNYNKNLPTNFKSYS